MMRSLLLFLTFLLAQSICAAENLTYPDLVNRLYNIKELSTIPPQGETCAQFSSYDRASKYDPATGKYINWDANGDGSGIIRKEGDNEVLAEMQGPGCIYLIWSAAPAAGHVRIYLDGQEQPVIDLPFNKYFDRSSTPFTNPVLVHETANGRNSYVPIPYQHSCRIVADPGWGLYYRFIYVTFPPDTTVPTFSLPLSDEDNAALAQAGAALTNSANKAPLQTPQNAQNLTGKVVIPPGQTVQLASLKGQGAIDRLSFTTFFESRLQECQALRELTLQINWDQEKIPSVWSPLGDFFGTAPGANFYRSYPLAVTPDGYYSRWYMPYSNGAILSVHNSGTEPRALQYSFEVVPPFQDASSLMRFHCKWHRNEFPPTEPGRQIDWTMLKTTGVGRYCGVELHIWNPGGGWWGEGDEKFFVDGEKFPSTFGTGSEDFFGYAWSSDQLFQNPLHNQTYNDGGSQGNISVNRWQIAESVPFQKSFDGCIEKYFPDSRPTKYDCTVYWYQKAGESDPYTPIPLADRLGYFELEYQPYTLAGAMEAEDMKVLNVTGGKTQTQAMSGYGSYRWSNAKQMWWTGAQPGDILKLAVPVAKTGVYSISTQLTKAVDYGIVQLSMDGKKLGAPFDGYNDGVIGTGDIPLGQMPLAAGKHTLQVEIIGANDKAVKSYMFGMDYLKLTEVKK
jgi:hypothetical protein